jgi:hypothetical protein
MPIALGKLVYFQKVVAIPPRKVIPRLGVMAQKKKMRRAFLVHRSISAAILISGGGVIDKTISHSESPKGDP